MHNRSSWQPQLFPIFHHHLAPLPTHIHSMHLMMMLLQLLLPPASCLPACHAVRLGLPGLLMTTGTAHLTGTPRPSKKPWTPWTQAPYESRSPTHSNNVPNVRAKFFHIKATFIGLKPGSLQIGLIWWPCPKKAPRTENQPSVPFLSRGVARSYLHRGVRFVTVIGFRLGLTELMLGSILLIFISKDFPCPRFLINVANLLI